GGDQPVAVNRPGAGADRQLHARCDAGVPGPADPRDPPLLDPDAGLHHPEEGVDHHHAGDQHVQLAVRGGPVELRLPGAEVLRVAPHRLIAVADVVVLDPDPQARVGEADEVAGRGAEAPRVVLAPHRGLTMVPAGICWVMQESSMGTGRISMPLPQWSRASPAWAGSATMITGSKAAIARATVAYSRLASSNIPAQMCWRGSVGPRTTPALGGGPSVGQARPSPPGGGVRRAP